jgi:PPOX class probable F420-dependent enzyme
VTDQLHRDPRQLTTDALAFVADRYLATLTTMRLDDTPHVVPIGFTYEPERRLVRIITRAGSRKVRHLGQDHRAAVSQIDGARWITLEGHAIVTDDPTRVAEAVRRYAERYRQPEPRVDRVAIELAVDRVMGRV